MVVAAVLLGTGAAVANVYLNFTLTCNSSGNGGSTNCPKDAVVFQGSVDLGATAPADGTYTKPVILNSATVYLNNSGYSSTGLTATAFGANSVTYTCHHGECKVDSVNLAVQTANGAFYFRPGGSGGNNIVAANANNNVIINSLKQRCVGSNDDECSPAAAPLHHPEINGATLPKAALLLGSLFLFMRERRQRAA
jgi:hypothetical protein